LVQLFGHLSLRERAAPGVDRTAVKRLLETVRAKIVYALLVSMFPTEPANAD